jgi:hypothetical protein
MKRLLRAAALLAVVVTAAPAWAIGFARQYAQVPGKVNVVVPADVNGDGRLDLAVSYTVGEKPNAKPHLAVFFGKPAGFSASPEVDLDLPGDACLFDLADLNGDGSQEAVVLRKWQVQSAALKSGEGGWETILSHGSGVLFPSANGVVQYDDFARDWNGDGAAELAIPDYGALLFYRRNDGGKFEAAGKVNEKMEGWLHATNPSTDEEQGSRVFGGVYLPRVFAVESGGARALALTVGEEIWLHQLQNGKFQEKGARFFLSILSEAERQADNSNVTTIVEDLNGDGFPDLAMLKVGGSLTNFRSAVRIYAGQAGGFAASPAYSLDMPGFIPTLRFWDVDGDGKPELCFPWVEVGMMQIARVFMTQSLKVKALVYRAGAAFYGKEPQLTREITMKANTERGLTFLGYPPNVSGDFDGDGKPDLLMSHGDGFGIWRNQGNLSFSSEPMATAAVEPWERVRLVDLNADGRCDMLAWDSARLERRGKIMALFTQ